MKRLMELINQNKIKDGQAVLWDEAGIDISHKSWQSLTNKLINFLLQTFRHKRIILIFTVPYLDFLDSSTRKLFHAELTTKKINYDTRKVRIKPQLIQYNSRFKKFYYKYLRVIKSNKRVAKIANWDVPAPPKWLIEEYERIKRVFTTKLNKDIEEQLDSIEKEKSSVKQPLLTPLQLKCVDLMNKYNDVSKVSKETDLAERTIYFHLAQARKKGYDIKEGGFKE